MRKSCGELPCGTTSRDDFTANTAETPVLWARRGAWVVPQTRETSTHHPPDNALTHSHDRRSHPFPYSHCGDCPADPLTYSHCGACPADPLTYTASRWRSLMTMRRWGRRRRHRWVGVCVVLAHIFLPPDRKGPDVSPYPRPRRDKAACLYQLLYAKMTVKWL